MPIPLTQILSSFLQEAFKALAKQFFDNIFLPFLNFTIQIQKFVFFQRFFLIVNIISSGEQFKFEQKLTGGVIEISFLLCFDWYYFII